MRNKNQSEAQKRERIKIMHNQYFLSCLSNYAFDFSEHFFRFILLHVEQLKQKNIHSFLAFAHTHIQIKTTNVSDIPWFTFCSLSHSLSLSLLSLLLKYLMKRSYRSNLSFASFVNLLWAVWERVYGKH